MKLIKKLFEKFRFHLIGLVISIILIFLIYDSITYFGFIESKYKINKIFTIISIIGFGLIFLLFSISCIGFIFLMESSQIESEYNDLTRHLKNVKKSAIFMLITNVFWTYLIFIFNYEIINFNNRNTLLLFLIPTFLNLFMIYFYIKSRNELIKTF